MSKQENNYANLSQASLRQDPKLHRAWRPALTLFRKEVLRFCSVASQTLLAPVITASLYLLIFGVSLGGRVSLFEEISYLEFVLPGLIMMGVLNNAFANVSSSLFMSRYLGNIVDLLVTPISPLGYQLAYTAAAMLRALLVGSVIALVGYFFAPLSWPHPFQALAMILVASFLFAQFGILAAIYASNFDTLSMFTNFLLLPAIYLGGLFFPVSELPSPWREISLANPIYYLIEGFRQAAIGYGSISFTKAFTGSLVVALLMAVVSYSYFAYSRKLRQ